MAEFSQLDIQPNSGPRPYTWQQITRRAVAVKLTYMPFTNCWCYSLAAFLSMHASNVNMLLFATVVVNMVVVHAIASGWVNQRANSRWATRVVDFFFWHTSAKKVLILPLTPYFRNRRMWVSKICTSNLISLFSSDNELRLERYFIVNIGIT